MRMLAYLKEPYKCNKNDAIYKIVLFSTMRGLLDDRGWQDIGEPMLNSAAYTGKRQGQWYVSMGRIGNI